MSDSKEPKNMELKKPNEISHLLIAMLIAIGLWAWFNWGGDVVSYLKDVTQRAEMTNSWHAKTID